MKEHVINSREEILAMLRVSCISLHIALLWIGGCAKQRTLIVTPVVYTATEIDPFDHLPGPLRTNQVEVFYATHRKGRQTKNGPRYGNGMDDRLHLGRATIQLGSSDCTWEELHRASVNARRDRSLPVTVARTTQLGELKAVFSEDEPNDIRYTTEFQQQTLAVAINERLQQASVKEINIYVHGYKVDFAHSVTLSGQLYHFGNRQGVMIGYDWASRQSALLYGPDVKRGKKSVAELAAFLAYLGEHTHAESINIVVWSAGAPILSHALRMLREAHPDFDHDELNAKYKIDDVIFAASDIDLRRFLKDMVRYHDLPRRIVVTVCYDDPALSLSRFIHGERSRLGSLDVSEVLEEERDLILPYLNKTEFIDVTDSMSAIRQDTAFSGHGYWYRNPWILTDILTTLYLGLPARERGLQLKEGTRKTWYFSEEYPERVAEAIYRVDRMRNVNQ